MVSICARDADGSDIVALFESICIVVDRKIEDRKISSRGHLPVLFFFVTV